MSTTQYDIQVKKFMLHHGVPHMALLIYKKLQKLQHKKCSSEDNRKILQLKLTNMSTATT